MPNRIIRESALTSHSLAKLSAAAERLFWRLTVVADDQGRFDAYPPTVKAKAFPTRVDELKTRQVIDWLVELSQDHCVFYTVKQHTYGQFRNWAEYQRQYGIKSKFPQPPAGCGESPQSAAESRSYLNLNYNLNYESISLSVDGGESEWSQFDEVWNAYPKKEGKEAARKIWKKLNGTRPDQAVLLDAIQIQKKSEQWQTRKYIPHFSSWLNGQRWNDEVAPEAQSKPKSMVDLL